MTLRAAPPPHPLRKGADGMVNMGWHNTDNHLQRLPLNVHLARLRSNGKKISTSPGSSLATITYRARIYFLAC
ncbi:hypothetical protein EM595_0922 [Duffyella gerundensis]|jgi:hypothetical protein|uniref:Uncharacterized protein n=1 Tax=Duffyella gerundensis TaxID=1619313 RepID=A0A0U5L2Z7_9GAMM|nr:hypothetical protein EM595_0922 [Duffyella gerundensis]